MTKLIIILLSVILLLLQYRIWLSDDGLSALLYLGNAVEKQQQDNLQLEQRNQILAAEVQDLKGGLEALEERARSELGMTKPGETFFQIINTNHE